MSHWLPNGEACGNEGDECTFGDQCLNGVCVGGHPKPKYTKCGDQSESECDLPDVCSGTGICEKNWRHDGSPCGFGGDDCNRPDTCYEGRCQSNGSLPDFTLCGNKDDSPCDHPDYCIGGECVDNLEEDGVLCGKDEDECNLADVCQTGVCTSTLKPNGIACGFLGDDCNYGDSCVDGLCQSNGPKEESTPCGSNTISGVCDEPDKCDVS